MKKLLIAGCAGLLASLSACVIAPVPPPPPPPPPAYGYYAAPAYPYPYAAPAYVVGGVYYGGYYHRHYWR